MKYRGKDAIVLAIPRGGIIVGNEISKALNANLDIVVPRKIGSPDDPEFAIGAVAPDGSISLAEDVIRDYSISEHYIKSKVKEEIKEIKRRMETYRGNNPFPKLKNKIIILVDDGVATGNTIIASVKFIKKQKPKKIVIAVPVAPSDFINKVSNMVDEVISLKPLEPYYAISMHYLNFGQTTDEEVIEILKRY
ncbi:MAG: phosphoribosyltransferase [Candidatus Aenigmarchaeota archaeon]|nr:phosphoribosyltransferase [Candidatus Aenigmarchaeota archaeon]